MRLLDTSIAVDHLRGRQEATRLVSGLIETGKTVLSSELSRFELLVGVHDDEMADLEAFFTALTWIPVTEDVMRVGGDLARRFRRSHSGIDDVDYLLAATALVLEVPLLTTNVRHFPMLADLRSPY